MWCFYYTYGDAKGIFYSVCVCGGGGSGVRIDTVRCIKVVK